MQSEHKSSTKSFEVIEGEVSPLEASPATPRRRWSVAVKEQIVAAATQPGSNVSAIARSNGLRPQQLFTWRRRAAIAGMLRDADTPVPSFSRVAIEAAATGGMVELVVGGMTLRIGATVPAARVTELLRAVRSA